MFYLAREMGKFGHRHLVYHFTVPLRTNSIKQCIYKTSETSLSRLCEEKVANVTHIKSA